MKMYQVSSSSSRNIFNKSIDIIKSQWIPSNKPLLKINKMKTNAFLSSFGQKSKISQLKKEVN